MRGIGDCCVMEAALCLGAVLLGSPSGGYAEWTEGAAGRRCPSYCDEAGDYVGGFYCTESPDVYCCGNDSSRVCCDNSTLDISGDYTDVYYCPNNSWWIFHWEVVIGLLGSMVMVLLVAACCCQCCATWGDSRRRISRTGARRRRARRGDEEDMPSVISDGNHMQMFNPDSPNAFEPPDYESLSKDPPKYADIFGGEASSATNEAFEPDTISNATLPPYEERTGECPPDSQSETAPENHNETPLVAHVQTLSQTSLGSGPADDLPPVRIHDESGSDLENASISTTSSETSNSTVIYINSASDELDNTSSSQSQGGAEGGASDLSLTNPTDDIHKTEENIDKL